MGEERVMTPASCSKYNGRAKDFLRVPMTHMKCQETVITPVLRGANSSKRAGDMS